MVAIAVATAAAMLLLSALLGRPRFNGVDISPYECGARPFQAVERHRFSIKFYLVAMLFILFDIEVVFLYPWAVVYREMLAHHANLIFGAMLSFLGVLFVGYLYALRKGAFVWKN
jgi:NADH-quinone oxidoreductase subunit A